MKPNTGVEPVTYRLIEFAVCILKLASRLGLEPRPTVLETGMLPLHYRDINWSPHKDLNLDLLTPNQERYLVTL